MKKIIFLSLVLFGFKAEAQKGIIFKVKYLPNHAYTGAINMKMNCQATLSGNDTIISKLATQGITQPITININLKMEGNTQTGAVTSGNTFPLTIKYKFDDLSVDINGKNIPIPTGKLSAGVSMYGHVDKDGRLRADSIAGKKIADTSEEKISKMMNAIQKNIKFPDHPMKIGETFTQDMPLNIPAAGNNLDLDTKVVYKLVSMADGNANFDVQQSMNMTIPVSGSSMIINGTGTGKLVYSIKNNFATDYSTNLVIKISGKIKTLQVDATATMNMDYKYEIN